jgi:beta-N-acetylhexosaminidase
MQAVSQMFAQKGTVAQAFNAGCDLLIVSRNLPASNLDRIRHIAADFTDSRAQGILAESVVAQSQSRITQLLATTPQYPVTKLHPEIFEQHAKLAIACSFS